MKVTYDHKLHFYWVVCSSFTTCGDCCRSTGLIALFSVNVKVGEAESPCCKTKELLYSPVHAHTKHGRISIQTSLCISDAPRTELSASLCCSQTPPPTAEPLCSLWTILPLCTTASSFHCSPPLCLVCTFPPLLMRINGQWSCASVWMCVRWHLNTVLTRMVGLTSQTTPQSTGAEHSAALRHNYSADNPV